MKYAVLSAVIAFAAPSCASAAPIWTCHPWENGKKIRCLSHTYVGAQRGIVVQIKNGISGGKLLTFFVSAWFSRCGLPGKKIGDTYQMVATEGTFPYTFPEAPQHSGRHACYEAFVDGCRYTYGKDLACPDMVAVVPGR
jgi:hypothetical protein